MTGLPKTLSPIDAAMASQPTKHPGHYTNRKNMVLKLAGLIDSALRSSAEFPDPEGFAGADFVANLSQENWEGLLRFAGITEEPSRETRAVLVAFYAERAKDVAAQEAEAAQHRDAEQERRDLLAEEGPFDASDYDLSDARAGA